MAVQSMLPSIKRSRQLQKTNHISSNNYWGRQTVGVKINPVIIGRYTVHYLQLSAWQCSQCCLVSNEADSCRKRTVYLPTITGAEFFCAAPLCCHEPPASGSVIHGPNWGRFTYGCELAPQKEVCKKSYVDCL